MNEDEIYAKMDMSDLFNEVWGELTAEKETDKADGKAEKDTLLLSRMAFVLAQKAKSYFNYLNMLEKGAGMYQAPKTELLLLDDEDEIVSKAFDRLRRAADALDNPEQGFRAFLRACPEHARHGVLESLEVNEDNVQDTYAHLRDVMRKEDPNGCMILQPFIPATSSMVLAPQMYAVVGKDHDGVTAGHGRQLYFLMNPDDTDCVEQFAAIGHKQGEYELEFVYQRDKNYKREKHTGGTINFTQVRGAPAHRTIGVPFAYEVMVDGQPVPMTATTSGCIPDGVVTATEVWECTGLEEVAWLEANIVKGKVPDGFVISHAEGSLLSHVCAHARANGIPYICAAVEVGDTWVEGSPAWVAKEVGVIITPEQYSPIQEQYLTAFRKGLNLSSTRWQRQHGWFAHFFHQWIGGLNLNVENAVLAGAFSGWAVKAALGLCMGELRHSRNLNKTATVDLYPVMTAAIGSDKWEELSGNGFASKNRKHYYAAMETTQLTYGEIKMGLKWCQQHFSEGWSGGFGGKAWASCAGGAARLCDAIVDFLNEPTEETILEVVARTNEAENFAHNNGSLYNKFLHGNAFNVATMNASGTGGLFRHSETGLKEVFRTYELAVRFLDGEKNAGINVPDNDWTEIFEFALGKNATWYRQHLIATDSQVPESIRLAVKSTPENMIHLNNKYTLNKGDFVPCGVSGCTHCEAHFDEVSTSNLAGEYASLTPMTSLLLNADYPEAYFALGKTQSSIDTYSVVQLLNAKQYDEVTPQAFKEAWDGLVNTDPAYKILSETLKKHLKKMLATNPAFSEEVQSLMGGDE
jgi:hypothetical protein